MTSKAKESTIMRGKKKKDTVEGAKGEFGQMW